MKSSAKIYHFLVARIYGKLFKLSLFHPLWPALFKRTWENIFYPTCINFQMCVGACMRFLIVCLATIFSVMDTIGILWWSDWIQISIDLTLNCVTFYSAAHPLKNAAEKCNLTNHLHRLWPKVIWCHASLRIGWVIKWSFIKLREQQNNYTGLFSLVGMHCILFTPIYYYPLYSVSEFCPWSTGDLLVLRNKFR